MHFSIKAFVSGALDGSTPLVRRVLRRHQDPSEEALVGDATVRNEIHTFQIETLGEIEPALVIGNIPVPLVLQSALVHLSITGESGHRLEVIDPDGTTAFVIFDLAGLDSNFSDRRWIIPPEYRLKITGPTILPPEEGE